MKNFFTLTLCFLTLSLTAQETITYPYNPEATGDENIGCTDLIELLTLYGGAFSPSDILVDGETLAIVLTNLQNSIDSLSALTGGSAGSVLDMPIGTVLPVASEAVPEGWMICDGREVAIEDYQELFDFIGTTYGAGDSAFWAQVNYPATTFNIPDLRGRTIIGADNMGGESAGVVSQHPSWLGKSGGAEMHQLTEDELPSHTHDLNLTSGIGSDPGSAPGIQYYNQPITGPSVSSQFSNSVGGNQPHNNMQPYIALNYMVKVQAAEDVFGELQQEMYGLENQLDSLLIANQTPNVNEGDLAYGGVVVKFSEDTKQGLVFALEPFGYGQSYRVASNLTNDIAQSTGYYDWRLPTLSEMNDILGPASIWLDNWIMEGNWFWTADYEQNNLRVFARINVSTENGVVTGFNIEESTGSGNWNAIYNSVVGVRTFNVGH